MFAGEIIAQSTWHFAPSGLPPDMFLRFIMGWTHPRGITNAHLRGDASTTKTAYVLDPRSRSSTRRWSIQKMYPLKSDREDANLRYLNIKYYYYIPNESRHAVNQRAGVQSWRGTPRLREIRRWGDNILYKINWSAEGLPDTPPARPAPLEDYIPRTRIEQ
jgi:hypothetical protein